MATLKIKKIVSDSTIEATTIFQEKLKTGRRYKVILKSTDNKSISFKINKAIAAISVNSPVPLSSVVGNNFKLSTKSKYCTITITTRT